MNIVDVDEKKQLIQRLRRIEGQIHGVQTMLDEERDCREIMQQMTAIRSAVQSANRAFVEEYASICLQAMDANSSPETLTSRETLLQEMITFLDKTL